jgi:hypothetical protein
MMQVYAEVITTVEFPKITVLEFVWFDSTGSRYKDAFEGVYVPKRNAGNRVNGMDIMHTRKPIASPLLDTDDNILEDMLLVAMYAWNGNSYPGNTYWTGAKGRGNGDLAAAEISTIPWIQNPDINEKINGKYAVVYPDDLASPVLASPVLASPSVSVDLDNPVEMIAYGDLGDVPPMRAYEP